MAEPKRQKSKPEGKSEEKPAERPEYRSYVNQQPLNLQESEPRNKGDQVQVEIRQAANLSTTWTLAEVTDVDIQNGDRVYKLKLVTSGQPYRNGEWVAQEKLRDK